MQEVDWLTKCSTSDDVRCTVLNVIRVLFGSLSFVLSLCMIFMIWLFKRYMFFSQRLILYLGIAALFDSIPYMMGNIDNTIGCKIQGYLMTYFDWTCVLWVCVITANMFRWVKEDISFESSESLFHLICWFIPALIAGVPFMWDSYGHSGPWCWIKGDQKYNQMLRFLIWYGPVLLLVIILTTMLIYLRVHTKIQNRAYANYNPEEENAKSRKWKEVRILFMYPIVFIVVSIFPLTTRIQMATSSESSFPLVLLTSMSAPLLGTANALLYSCSEETRQQMRPAFIWEEIKHRKHETTSEAYHFAEESTGNNASTGSNGGDTGDITPYDQ